MGREILGETELVRIINDKLAATEAASECKFSGVFKLRGLDDEGCNWSMGVYRSGNTPVEICGPVVDKVVRELQGKYNITDS